MANAKKWFNGAIIYHVFIDRFCGFTKIKNKNGFVGGNIKGVISKLDYLNDLGINVIWLSPFYETVAYHGYHITDFKKVDSRFGTLDDLQKLIKKANKLGIRIIADFVPNHCSVEHPYFKDAQKNKDSKYSNWFVWNKKGGYLSFLDFKELPKLNLKNNDTKKYMIEVAEYWLSMGISGFRIDHVIGPPHSFWKDLYAKVNNKYPEAILFGEAWAAGLDKKLFKTLGIKNKMKRRKTGISQYEIQLEYYNEMDGVLDFVLNGILIDAAKKGKKSIGSKKVKKLIEEYLKSVPKGYQMVTFLDNHDMNRFLRYCKGNVDILLKAFDILFSLNYPVVIYNGTENCTYNKKAVSFENSHSDLLVREPIDWDNINEPFVKEFKKMVVKYRGYYTD